MITKKKRVAYIRAEVKTARQRKWRSYSKIGVGETDAEAINALAHNMSIDLQNDKLEYQNLSDIYVSDGLDYGEGLVSYKLGDNMTVYNHDDCPILLIPR